MKILVINPGSTSTKLAVYENENPIWRESDYNAATIEQCRIGGRFSSILS